MFRNLTELANTFQRLGVQQLLCKRLAENDNSKQQIYLGTGFQALNLLPFGEVESSGTTTIPTMKAPIPLSWIGENGIVTPARHAQLILYPSYPEVRLSGFLRGCPSAPSELMRPTSAGRRRHNNGPDGRLLFFGITGNRTILAHAAADQSDLANDFKRYLERVNVHEVGVFIEIPLSNDGDSRSQLLAKLREIHKAGWHNSCRLTATRELMPYVAQNGAGYTLEALLDIVPNGRAEPDYLGWELKACGSDRLTLMTPEPDSGYYGENGVEAFVRRYGRDVGSDTLYFTGMHSLGRRCDATSLTLQIGGFNSVSEKITDVNGGVYLVENDGTIAAGWSFRRMLHHWGRKHAFAAYVPYEKRQTNGLAYRFTSPVSLAEGTTFVHFLNALNAGRVFYDPAPKVMGASSPRPRVKARSQFRIRRSALSHLYERFESESLE